MNKNSSTNRYTAYYILCQLPWWCSSKESPAMQELQETLIQSLCLEYHLEEGMTTHSSILAWRIPWAEESGRLQPIGLQSDTTEAI